MRKNRLYDNIQLDTKARLGMSKLMVVGEGGAGKTATVRSLLGKRFDPIWNSTVGIDLSATQTGVSWVEQTTQSQTTALLHNALKQVMQPIEKPNEDTEETTGESVRQVEELVEQQEEAEEEETIERDEGESHRLQIERIRQLDSDLVFDASGKDDAVRLKIW